MSRLLGLFVHNWPLKLAAIAASTALYLGFVISQNERVWSGPLTTRAINQSTEAFLLDQLPDVTGVRYLAPVDVANRISDRDFRATVDLSAVQTQPGGAPVSVPIRVEALNPRIQVRGWEPQFASVRLDPIITRIVPVRVNRGIVPDGLVPGRAEIDPMSVTVRGAASLVQRVRVAEASVTIEPSAINVDNDFELRALDGQGTNVFPVDLEPATAHIKIEVGRRTSSRALPIDAPIVGTLPPGYDVLTVDVTPLTVTLSGDQVRLGQLSSVSTVPIDVTGRTASFEQAAEVQLPEGMEVLGTSEVRVAVRIVPKTGSRSYSAAVTYSGERPGHRYQLSVPDVLVTLEGTVNALSTMDPATLLGRIDVAALGPGVHQVPVDVAPPQGTAVVSVSPAQVGVTVLAPTPPPSPTPAPTPSVPPVLPSVPASSPPPVGG